MNKKLLSLFIITIFVLAPFTGMAEETDLIEFPNRKLYVDGSYLPKDPLGLNNMPQAYQLPVDIRSQYADLKSAGDIDSAINLIPDDFTWTSNDMNLFKREDQIRVSFSLGLDAPVNTFASDSMSDLPIIPDIDDEYEASFGFPTLAGDENEQYVNHTKISGTWNYATDYLVASYNVLILENIKSVSTTNVSIIVSYGNATGASIATAATAFNLTIFNELLPVTRDLWFRLDKEVEIDGNGTDAAILNVEVNGDMLGTRRLVSYDADALDARYIDTYIGGRTTGDKLDLSTDDVRFFSPGMDSSTPPSLSTDTLTDGEVLDLVGIPFYLLNIATEVVNSVVGWDSAEELEAAIQLAIDEISAYTVTDVEIDLALFAQHFTADTVDETKDVALEEEETNSDLGNIMSETFEETFLKNLVGIGEDFFDDLMNSSSISGAVNIVIDALSTFFGMAMDGATQFAQDVTEFITDDAKGINEGLLNILSKPLIDTTTGEVSLNWQLLLIVAAVIVVAILVSAFIVKKFM